MKTPLVLRLELAWAALTGSVQQISFGPIPGADRGCWRFDIIDRNLVRRWEARNKRLRRKRAQP